LREELPALSHYFHLTWADIETMPAGELRAYRSALPNLKG
jgi:hypothetical protein